MKQLATVFTITALTAFAPAMAEVNTMSVSASTAATVAEMSAVSTSVPTDSELAFAIGDSQNLQAVVMTDEQMQETEGAWAANAFGGVIGGLTGHYGYMGNSIASGEYNLVHHIGAIGVGVGTGALNPIGSVGRAITMTSTGRAIGTAAIGIGGSTATGHYGNKVKTLNIR